VYDVPDWDVAKEEHAKRQLARLREAAPNFTDDVIEAMLVKSPKDYEKLNPHMVHGAFHGGDRGIAQSGGLRPAPGWGSHRMPIPGLYQTGATTNPGGSITGAPGRNAAMVLLHDLGHDPAEAMNPTCPSVPGAGSSSEEVRRGRRAEFVASPFGVAGDRPRVIDRVADLTPAEPGRDR